MEKFNLDFGLIIAYLIPGFIATYALSPYIAVLNTLVGGPHSVPSGSAIIPLLLISLAVGNVIHAVAWATIRPLIALTGIKRPAELDYAKLSKEDIEVYRVIVAENFRYYQFYSNTLVALLMFVPDWIATVSKSNLFISAGLLAVAIIVFLAARDALNRAYYRMSALLTKGGIQK